MIDYRSNRKETKEKRTCYKDTYDRLLGRGFVMIIVAVLKSLN